MRRRLTLVGVAMLLMAAARWALAAPPVKTVPLEVLDSGHIAVKVILNNAGPFRFVLDTGSPVTLIGNRTAQLLGLIAPSPAGSATPPSGLLGLLKSFGQATLKTVDVGGMQVDNIPVMILDHPVVAMLSRYEGPIDGILGFSFFSHCHMTLDYAAGKVSFSPVDYTPRDVMQSLMAQMMNREPVRRVLSAPALWGMVLDRAPDVDGVAVTQVYAKSAAEAAGLKAGDRILLLEERWTESVPAFYEAAGAVKPGQTVTLTVLRAGKEIQLQIRPRLGL
jgi:hypothetical protein